VRRLPLVLLTAAGCAAGPAAARAHDAPSAARFLATDGTDGRLSARPGAIDATVDQRGVFPLGIGDGRDGRILVPKGYTPGKPAPLVVLLHGAGASGADIIGAVQKEAEAAGAIVLAPDSRGTTWDVLRGGFGPDVRFIDESLRQTFARHSIDRSRIALAGFSDGASYALSLGQANGDLFDAIVAFSPGFSAPPRQVGKSRVFVSHGTDDRVLPIDPCSRTIVPRLQEQGFEVRYLEFDGGHSVPANVAHQAVAWWLGR